MKKQQTRRIFLKIELGDGKKIDAIDLSKSIKNMVGLLSEVDKGINKKPKPYFCWKIGELSFENNTVKIGFDPEINKDKKGSND